LPPRPPLLLPSTFFRSGRLVLLSIVELLARLFWNKEDEVFFFLGDSRVFSSSKAERKTEKMSSTQQQPVQQQSTTAEERARAEYERRFAVPGPDASFGSTKGAHVHLNSTRGTFVYAASDAARESVAGARFVRRVR
jgi:hypothetical protein